MTLKSISLEDAIAMQNKKTLSVCIWKKTCIPGKQIPGQFYAAGIAKEWKNSITFDEITNDGIKKITVEKKNIVSIETMEEE